MPKSSTSKAEALRQTLNSPLNSIIKNSVLSTIQIEVSKQDALEKISQLESIKKQIEEIFEGKWDTVKSKDKSRQKAIDLANEQLSETMAELKKEVQKLVDEMKVNLQKIDKLHETYVEPLNSKIAEAIESIKQNTREIMGEMLEDSNISQAFRTAASAVNFDIDDYEHDESAKVDYVDLVRPQEGETDNFTVLKNLCRLNVDDSEVSWMSAVLDKIEASPNKTKLVKDFMKSFEGTDLITRAKQELASAREKALDITHTFEEDMDMTVSDIDKSIKSCFDIVRKDYQQLDSMDIRAQRQSQNIVDKHFGWEATMMAIKEKKQVLEQVKVQERDMSSSFQPSGGKP